jgi:hypothetical protein
MNEQGMRYHAEIVRRMKRGDGPQSGVDARSVRGLLRYSKQGQERLQEFLFPTQPRSWLSAQVFGALATFAERTDRWLATRALTPARA